MANATLVNFPVRDDTDVDIDDDGVADRTFREWGVLRARALLNSVNTIEMYDPITNIATGSHLNVADYLINGGNITTLGTVPTSDGYGLRMNTDAQSGSIASAFTTGFFAALPATTSGWMVRCRIRAHSAVNAQQRITMAVTNSTSFDIELGVVGTGYTGGSATKFVMTKVDAGAVRRAGATSSISLDTTATHTLELWHPVGDANIYGSVDYETAISMSAADLANVAVQTIWSVHCGTAAAIYQASLYEWQRFTVNPA